MGEKTDFIAGIVIGALAGIGLGMLLAPQSGQMTRRRLLDRADEMGTRLRSSADEITGRMRQSADDLSQRGRTVVDELSQRGRMAVDEGSRRLRDAYERGREGLAGGGSAGEPRENDSV
jgi:gas vesicle protein